MGHRGCIGLYRDTLGQISASSSPKSGIWGLYQEPGGRHNHREVCVQIIFKELCIYMEQMLISLSGHMCIVHLALYTYCILNLMVIKRLQNWQEESQSETIDGVFWYMYLEVPRDTLDPSQRRQADTLVCPIKDRSQPAWLYRSGEQYFIRREYLVKSRL